MKIRNKAAIAALAAVLVGGCGKKAPEPETITVARATAVQSLQPATANSADDMAIVSAVYEGLTQLEKSDLGWAARPALAEKWSIDDGGESWVFTLAPERVFSDGSAVDTAAVIASFQQAKAAGGMAANLLADVGRVGVDDGQIRFSLTRVVADFPELLAHPALAIVGNDGVGSGAYKIVKQSADSVTLETNEKSPRPPAQFDRVVVNTIAPTKQLEALNAGKILASATLPANAIATQGTEKWTAYWQPESAAMVQLTFNLRKAELQSLPLRQGLVSAINYDALPAVVAGNATPLGNFMPPAVNAYRDNERLPQSNPSAAKSLLAGVSKELKLQLLAPESLQPLAIALAANFAQAGVEVTANVVNLADYNAALSSGNYQLLLQENQASSPNSLSLLLPMFGDPAKDGLQNFSGYSNKAVWQLLSSADISNDPERRNQLINTAIREINKQLPVLPLYSPHQLVVAASGMPQPKNNPFLPATLPLATLVRETSAAPK